MLNSTRRNIAVSLQMYAADNDDCLPSAEGWRDQVMEYLRDEEVLLCMESTGHRYSYAYNQRVAGLALGRMAAPEKTVTFFETDARDPTAGGPDLLPDEPKGTGREGG